MKYFKTTVMLLVFVWFLVIRPDNAKSEVDLGLVPDYVTAGLSAYGTKGYEAAVHVWLADSAYKNAITLVSSLTFFKNIQMLAGKYLSYDILMTKETISSNVVYVRMNFERMPGYILFTSFKSGDKWVLGNIHMDKTQKFGTK